MRNPQPFGFLFIVAVLLTSSSLAQIDKQLYAILLKKDFRALQQFANGYQVEKAGVKIETGNVRDLTPGYQEAMYHITKSYPVFDAISESCRSNLRLIKKDNLIIYYAWECNYRVDFPNSYK